MDKKSGIIIAGTIAVDYCKYIDYYPEKTMLSSILKCETTFGGAVYNVSGSLAKLKTNFPVEVMSLLGIDENSELLLKQFELLGIDTQHCLKSNLAHTPYTDVMIEVDSGKRTFFHYKGTNSILDYEHFKTVKTKCKIFHIGYLLLLDKLDSFCPEEGLVSAKVLKMLSQAGFLTSVDLVSVNNPDLNAKIVKYCLKNVDYLIINETETEGLTGLKVRDEIQDLDLKKLTEAAEFLIKSGVRKYVVIHCPEGGLAVDHNLSNTFIPAYKLNSKDIINSTGAGDAFCAGILYALHEDLAIDVGLKIANATARDSLLHETSIGGIKPLNEVMQFI